MQVENTSSHSYTLQYTFDSNMIKDNCLLKQIGGKEKARELMEKQKERFTSNLENHKLELEDKMTKFGKLNQKWKEAITNELNLVAFLIDMMNTDSYCHEYIEFLCILLNQSDNLEVEEFLKDLKLTKIRREMRNLQVKKNMGVNDSIFDQFINATKLAIVKDVKGIQ